MLCERLNDVKTNKSGVGSASLAAEIGFIIILSYCRIQCIIVILHNN